MPAITSQVNSTHRTSFYGRSRMSSTGSNDSNNSSQRRKTSNSSSTSSTSSSTAATTSMAGSSSSSSSCSPRAKKVVSVATNPSLASGSSFQIKVDCSAEDSPKRSTLLDEEEYQTQVVEHMHHMEGETIACVDLMDAQPELKWFMRPYLVDFIVEIHQTFRLRPETLFLTMNIVDRYVSKRIVYKRHFQLVGCAALLIASKFEDSKDKVPTVSELSQMCCSAYDESAFTQMEGHVLSTIGWCLGFPTPEAWLRITCALNNVDAKTQSIARFFMEASLFHRDFITISPSKLAAGALLLAKHIAGQVVTTTLPPQEESQNAISAAQFIDTYMTEHVSELSEILVKKYSFNHFANASTLVKEWFAKSAMEKNSQRVAGAAAGLLPAQSVSAQNLTLHDKTTKMITQQPSSFNTPRRGQDEEDEDVTMQSSCTTPSSMISTPSRMSGDDEEEYDDEDEDEEEENDMPVTPLSLNSLHDPLVAAQSSSQCDSHQKENNTINLHSIKNNNNNHNNTNTTATSTQSSLLQVRNSRSALSIS